MGLFGGKRIHKSRSNGGMVDVSEEKGIRSLHLGSITVQSSMKVSAPDELVLEYTRCMMGFLLFHPEPEEILMIGLGGGSMAKWAYRYLPQTCCKTIEINPQVLLAARNFFCVPPDDERFQVILSDGAEYVVGRAAIADAILIDGYDGVSMAEQLNSESFYAYCREALTADGVLAVNLWGNDPDFDIYLQRIERAFDGLVCCLPAKTKGNVTAFAFKRNPGSPKWQDLRELARQLEVRYPLEFCEFVGQLAKLNPHTDKRLLLG